jgi:hypothetical protein
MSGLECRQQPLSAGLTWSEHKGVKPPAVIRDAREPSDEVAHRCERNPFGGFEASHRDGPS